mgnify:CR=1 FL=1
MLVTTMIFFHYWLHSRFSVHRKHWFEFWKFHSWEFWHFGQRYKWGLAQISAVFSACFLSFELSMSSSGVWHMSITTWGKGSFLTNLLFFLLPIMPKMMGSDLSIMRWKVSIFLFSREVWRACFNRNFLMSLLALKNSKIIQIVLNNNAFYSELFFVLAIFLGGRLK